MERDSKCWLLFLGVAIAWGSSFLFIDIALADNSPITITFLRSLLGFLTLTIWCKIKRIPFLKPSVLWIHLGVLSLLLNSLPSFLFALAQKEISTTIAGLINATTPMLTVLFVYILFKGEKIYKAQILGIVVSFIGIAVLLDFSKGYGSNSAHSVLALFGAVFCFAISYPYIRKFLSRMSESPEAAVAVQLGLSTVTLSPFFLFSRPVFSRPPTSSVLAILMLGIFASGMAYLWNFRLIAIVGSTSASMVSYLIPLIALVMGITVLGEEIRVNEIFGGAIILSGLALSRREIAK